MLTAVNSPEILHPYRNDAGDGRDEMKKLTTKRVIQLSNLADDFSSRARVCFRGGANLKKIGNNKGAHYLFYRAVRFQRIALNAASRLEV